MFELGIFGGQTIYDSALSSHCPHAQKMFKVYMDKMYTLHKKNV